MKWRIVAGIVLCVVFILSLSQVVLAASSQPGVSYDGQQKKLSLVNAPNSDLFLSFKQLMPGDQKEQTVMLQAKNINHPVHFYLRAKGSDEIDLPPGISLSVYHEGTVIFEGPIDSNAVHEDVLLHTFDTEGSASLTIVLNVPVSVGNEIQNLEKHIYWDFVVQDSETENSPETGVTSNLMAPMAGMLISGIGLVLLLLFWLLSTRKNDKK